MKLDIHCHLLPGLDDGPADPAGSLAMARAAAADGREVIVATPHYWPGRFTPEASAVRAALRKLQAALDDAGIPLRLLAGHEVRVAPEVPGWVAADRVCTLADAGRHLLLELPPAEIPPYTEQVCFQLLLRGVTPVIAHPERNAAVARDQRRLLALVERGCLVQVNAGSLTGKFGRAAQTTAAILHRRGVIHFVASDGHGTGERGVEMIHAARFLPGRTGLRQAAFLAEVGAAHEAKAIDKL